MQLKSIRFAVAAAVLATLQACGGGGGGSESSALVADSSPEGAWGGTALSNGETLDIVLVVLENGQYYGVYAQGGAAYGLLEGTGTGSRTSFSSSNGRDFGFGELDFSPFSLMATFTPKLSISGSANYSDFTSTFSANYDSTYETAASLSAIAGSYSGSAGSLEGNSTFNLTIDSSGALAGTTSTGCQVSGTLSPRNSTTAVFNLTVTYNSATCDTGVTVKGIAGRSGPEGLIFAATLPDRSDAFYAVASRP